MFVDMHTHSEFSTDSVCPILDMAKAQKEMGTNIFAVTDHFDMSTYVEKKSIQAIKNCHNKIDGLQLNDIEILKGIEFGEANWDIKLANNLIKELQPDVAICSTHAILIKSSLCIHIHNTNFSTFTKEEINNFFLLYFKGVQENIKMDCDILAHLTLPLRYFKAKYDIDVDITHYNEQINLILDYIIKNNIALEINTSALKTGIKDFLPDKEIVNRYLDMGGKMLTLGSDAHASENASYGFIKAKEMLNSLGITEAYYFKNRQPVKYEL
ncbi:MAG: histidinol-phosphatase HisJ family protein [Clostridiales bacterium]|nr:histidinol-phosphatase HisJ family protein [Clostridiales bacterium]